MFLNNIKKEAFLMKDYMMSVREIYQKQFVKSGIILDENTLGFLPAHALGKISDVFIESNHNNFYIKNVSKNPRNRDNLADEEELKAIEFFEKNREKNEYFENYKENGVDFYQFATPIKIEKRCLICHGKKEETNEMIQKLYTTAFDYNQGDIKGIVSIKIPHNSIFEKLNDFIFKEILFALISITLIYIILISLYKTTSHSIEEANKNALTDGLTGLKNRHYLKPYLNNICYEFATSFNKKFAVAFIDIDFFKKINDKYGHDTGDLVLQTFASKLQSLVRDDDILCRFGGEEFLLILTNIKDDIALKKLEEIRKEIEQMKFICLNEALTGITISIGVSFNGLNKTLKKSIKEADIAVYQAKKAGRNIVCAYENI